MQQPTESSKQVPEESRGEFATLAESSSRGTLAEFFDFLKNNKKWWLAPIIIALVGIGVLVVLSGGSAAFQFIYTLF